MSYNKPPENVARNTLTTQQKEALFLAAVLDKKIYDTIYNAQITIDHFSEMDYAFYYIWRTTDRFVQKQHQLPTVMELHIELGVIVDDLKEGIPNETVYELEQLLDKLYTLSAPYVITVETAKTYLAQFIEEKVWRDVQRVVTQHGQVPQLIRSTMDNILAGLNTAEMVMTKDVGSPFPEGYDEDNKLKTVPYGVPFIDAYLGGGSVAGEVYCLLGPTGSCKTTLAQQLSESLALLQLSKWEHNNRRGSLGVVYFASYELPKKVIQYRAIAHVAQIDFNVLRERSPLSVKGMLNERDRALFAKQIASGLYVPSETERKRSAEMRLSHNWRLLDFSGMEPDSKHIGGGGVEEIAGVIEGDMEAQYRKGLKRHVSGIFLDYVGMLGKRQCEVNNLDITQKLRQICLGVIDKSRRKLAAKFNCPVLLTHQLNPEGSSLPPGVIANKRQSAEANGLAENCDFVFVVSNLTTQNRLGRINCQKQRRFDGLRDTLIQVQGAFAQVVNGENLWVWNEDTRDFSQRRSKDDKTESTTFDGQKLTLFDLIN